MLQHEEVMDYLMIFEQMAEFCQHYCVGENKGKFLLAVSNSLEQARKLLIPPILNGWELSTITLAEHTALECKEDKWFVVRLAKWADKGWKTADGVGPTIRSA